MRVFSWKFVGDNSTKITRAYAGGQSDECEILAKFGSDQIEPISIVIIPNFAQRNGF